MDIIEHIANGIANHEIDDYGKFTFSHGAYEIEITITETDEGKWKPEKRIRVEMFYSPPSSYSEFDNPEDAFVHAAREATQDIHDLQNDLQD